MTTLSKLFTHRTPFTGVNDSFCSAYSNQQMRGSEGKSGSEGRKKGTERDGRYREVGTEKGVGEDREEKGRRKRKRSGKEEWRQRGRKGKGEGRRGERGRKRKRKSEWKRVAIQWHHMLYAWTCKPEANPGFF